jgi:hypothetical protein
MNHGPIGNPSYGTREVRCAGLLPDDLVIRHSSPRASFVAR